MDHRQKNPKTTHLREVMHMGKQSGEYIALIRCKLSGENVAFSLSEISVGKMGGYYFFPLGKAEVGKMSKKKG